MVALLLFPSVSADSPVADFEFTSASFRGEWQATDPNQRAAVVVPAGSGESRFAWTLEADHIALNWSQTTRYEVVHPTNPGTRSYVAKEPPRQWDEATPAHEAVGQSRSSLSNILVVGASNTAPIADIRTTEFIVQSGEGTWYAGSEAGTEVSTQPPVNTQVRYEHPEDYLQIASNKSTIQLSGDFAMAVWDARVKLNETNEWRTVETGRTERGVAQNVRESDHRLLWIHAKNATLFLDVHLGPVLLASPTFGFRGAGVASFQGSSGLLTQDAETYALDREPVRVTGMLDAELVKETARPRANLEISKGEVEFEGASLDVARTPEVASESPLRWAWGALLLLPAAWLCVRRFRPVTIDDVEWAILSGKSRRGLSLAKRLVAKNPQDPDAVFLYGTTLLARGRFASVLETIEPLGLKIEPRLRRGIAFVLAVAAHGSNDPLRTRRWAKEAAQDPQLRNRLEEDGVLAASPSVLQSGYA